MGSKRSAVKRDKIHFQDGIHRYCFVCVFAIVTVLLNGLYAYAKWPKVTPSTDGVHISYEVYGSGEPTLVFVHGWSCDSRYWRMQVPYFMEKYRVVVLDLAGHGHSGSGRTDYSMRAFGEDVRAVVNAVAGEEIILIGHSMGGAVIAQAARLMPERVVGLIGVDTFHNVEYPMTREELEKMTAPLKEDFKTGSRAFVGQMLLPENADELREFIVSDMASAPSKVALSAMEEMMGLYITGEAAEIFTAIKAPVVAVNADLWPTDPEANREHMASFEAIVLKGTDHFLMMNTSDEFNFAIEQAVKRLLQVDVQ